MTLEQFFDQFPKSRRLFEHLADVIQQIAPAEIRVSKSQVAFVHKKPFAWAWIPGKYLQGKTAPLVLSISFQHREVSPRWKEIVEPYPGRFMHHLELRSISEIDSQVQEWLKKAWENASQS